MQDSATVIALQFGCTFTRSFRHLRCYDSPNGNWYMVKWFVNTSKLEYTNLRIFGLMHGLLNQYMFQKKKRFEGFSSNVQSLHGCKLRLVRFQSFS